MLGFGMWLQTSDPCKPSQQHPGSVSPWQGDGWQRGSQPSSPTRLLTHGEQGKVSTTVAQACP